MCYNGTFRIRHYCLVLQFTYFCSTQISQTSNLKETAATGPKHKVYLYSHSKLEYILRNQSYIYYCFCLTSTAKSNQAFNSQASYEVQVEIKLNSIHRIFFEHFVSSSSFLQLRDGVMLAFQLKTLTKILSLKPTPLPLLCVCTAELNSIVEFEILQKVFLCCSQHRLKFAICQQSKSGMLPTYVYTERVYCKSQS